MNLTAMLRKRINNPPNSQIMFSCQILFFSCYTLNAKKVPQCEYLLWIKSSHSTIFHPVSATPILSGGKATDYHKLEEILMKTISQLRNIHPTLLCLCYRQQVSLQPAIKNQGCASSNLITAIILDHLVTTLRQLTLLSLDISSPTCRWNRKSTSSNWNFPMNIVVK